MCENCNSKTWVGKWNGVQEIKCEHDWEWIDIDSEDVEYRCKKCGAVEVISNKFVTS
jgi:DNA-directed RNA polymerase subunit RPC12/RpoP